MGDSQASDRQAFASIQPLLRRSRNALCEQSQTRGRVEVPFEFLPTFRGLYPRATFNELVPGRFPIDGSSGFIAPYRFRRTEVPPKKLSSAIALSSGGKNSRIFSSPRLVSFPNSELQ